MSPEPIDVPSPQQQALATEASSQRRTLIIVLLGIATLLLAGLLFCYLWEHREQDNLGKADSNKTKPSTEFLLSGTEERSLRLQASREAYLEKRTQTFLDQLLGEARSLVRVTVVLDPEQSETTQELFDPEESAVRSEQLSQNRASGQIVPPEQTGLDEQNQELVHYEINKTTTRKHKPAITVRRLAVTILVDDKTLKDLPEWVFQDSMEEQTEPNRDRSQQALAVVKTLAISALGMDIASGDSVEVLAVPLLQSKPQTTGLVALEQAILTDSRLVLLLFCILLAILVLYQRSTVRRRKISIQDAKPVSSAEQQQVPALDFVTEQSLAQVQDSVRKDPLFSAHVLKNWLNGQV